MQHYNLEWAPHKWIKWETAANKYWFSFEFISASGGYTSSTMPCHEQVKIELLFDANFSAFSINSKHSDYAWKSCMKLSGSLKLLAACLTESSHCSNGDRSEIVCRSWGTANAIKNTAAKNIGRAANEFFVCCLLLVGEASLTYAWNNIALRILRKRFFLFIRSRLLVGTLNNRSLWLRLIL